MSDPYKDIGFDSNRIGFGKRAGVVVVDFQKGFTESRFPLGGRPMVERAVNNTAQLLAAARKAGLPVASCYTAYSSARDAPLWKIPTVVNEFHHGHPCTELDERIYDRAYDMVVCKTGPSIFFNTPVATFFVKEGVYRHRLRLQHFRLCAREHQRRILLRLPRHRAGALLRRCRRRPAPRQSARRRAPLRRRRQPRGGARLYRDLGAAQ